MTVGQSAFFGILQQGVLTWTSPIDFAFGVGGLLEVSLTNEVFNTGLFGLKPGERKGATVQANFTLIKEPTAVPLPGALPLFAGGLAGLGWLGRRRKRKQHGAV